jgi:hypothetical protein
MCKTFNIPNTGQYVFQFTPPKILESTNSKGPHKCYNNVKSMHFHTKKTPCLGANHYNTDLAVDWPLL